MNLVGVQNGKADTFFGALSNIKKGKIGLSRETKRSYFSFSRESSDEEGNLLLQ